MNLRSSNSESTTKDGNYMFLLADPIIAKIFIAILISTIAMATLEPCLPIWLMATLKPEVLNEHFNIHYKQFIEAKNFKFKQKSEIKSSNAKYLK